ncbi:hypothetical protein ACH5RR_001393 [Cinchona calisaya]|uniref:Uncharacterized protein n=1 Tax=Cinchona calisaya TaxID=153742 RepID=A0ABD3B395_9GENT
MTDYIASDQNVRIPWVLSLNWIHPPNVWIKLNSNRAVKRLGGQCSGKDKELTLRRGEEQEIQEHVHPPRKHFDLMISKL